MAAELGWYLIVRVAAVPDGNRELHGLEVEERERRLEWLERASEVALHDHAARPHRAPLPFSLGVESQPAGQVLYRDVSKRLELLRPVLAAKERADVMPRQPAQQRAMNGHS